VVLRAELLDHVDLDAQARQRRVGGGTGGLEVGRPHAQDHAAIQAAQR
jgi:hypothetical protein